MATEKRLTEKRYNGKGYYMKCSGLCHFDGHCANCDELVKIVDRLGEYEDKAAQTVDAVEVVHGQWKESNEIKSFRRTNIPVVQCSKCECYFCDIINNHHYMYRYCPNCGAKMDGDRNG